MKKSFKKRTVRSLKKRNKAYRPMQVSDTLDEVAGELYEEHPEMSDWTDSGAICCEPQEVKVKAPLPEDEIEGLSHKQKRVQAFRKLAADLDGMVKSGETQLPGFEPKRITLNKTGRVKAGSVKLPIFYQQILTSCKNLITDRSALPSLQAYCPAMNREVVRVRTAQILAVLLTSTEFEGGRIGIHHKGVGIMPVTHHRMRQEFLLRFGFEICEKTWYNTINRLKASGLLQTVAIQAVVELKNQLGEQFSVVRSEASYKQFTECFFREFKVTRYTNVADLIRAGIAKMKAKGYSFKWVNYNHIVNQLRDRVQANFLNELIDNTSPVTGFQTYSSPLPPN